MGREFAHIPDLDEPQQQAGLALYLTVLRRFLLQHEAFRQVIIDPAILRIEGKVNALIEVTIKPLERRMVWPVISLPPDPTLRAYILRPEYRLLPYMGKHFQAARDELLAWAKGLAYQPGRVGLRCYTGPGGSGKTRLLIEAREILRSEGWWVGFLASGEMTDDLAERLVIDPRPTLLIMDYVSARDAEIRPLLQAAARTATATDANADLPPRDTPLALVFLEREMPPWLEEALNAAGDPAYVRWPEFRALLGVEQCSHPLAPLEPENRQAFFKKAVERLQETFRLSVSPPEYPAEALPERPLALALLALHAVIGKRLEDLSEAGILEATWQREREAWARLLQDDLETHGVAWAMQGILERVERLAMLATLGRVFADTHALADFLKQAFPPFQGARQEDEVRADWLAPRLAGLFPQHKGSVIPPITPDPLADFVLCRGLKRDPHPAGAGPAHLSGA